MSKVVSRRRSVSRRAIGPVASASRSLYVPMTSNGDPARLDRVSTDDNSMVPALPSLALTLPTLEHLESWVRARVPGDGSLNPLDMTGFVVLPKRWIVERTFGWFGRYRRLLSSRADIQKNSGMSPEDRKHLNEILHSTPAEAIRE